MENIRRQETLMKWQDDTQFCEWMCDVQYLQRLPLKEGKKQRYTPNGLDLGLVLYMYEAWVAASQRRCHDN